LKYVREPGYIYDLFFVYALHFNRDTLLNDIINHNNATAEKQYFTSVLELFEPIPEELYLFFHMKDRSRTFMTRYYFYAYESELFCNFGFLTVMNALGNYEQVKRNLLQFYFSNLDDNSINECINSLHAVCMEIASSEYDEKLKCSLFAFFTDPTSVMLKLLHSLQTAEIKLSQYYEKNYQKLLNAQSTIDADTFDNRLKELGNYQVDFSNCKKVYYSICIVLKNCIRSLYDLDVIHLLVGWDYESRLEYLIAQTHSFQLDVLGTALSEPNRVELFKMMYACGEITVKDIEQTMKISGTNAYYHLMLMLKANIVQTRNKGRTVHYSINKNQMDVISKFFSQYGNNPPEVK